MGKFEKLLSYIKGLDKNTSEQGRGSKILLSVYF